MHRTLVHDAALAAALFLSAQSFAQQPAPAAESPLLREGIRRAVEVKAMDLDVVATKNGQPVNDLKKEDFVVKVDGKPVPIDYFARVDSGTLHGPDLATASPDVVLETLKNDRGDRFLARQFLVFFDDEHLLPFERNRVIENMRDFVQRLTPSDRVSIVSYGATKRLIIPFTSSKEELLDGLSRLEKVAPGGLRWDNDYRRTVIDLQRTRAFSRQQVIRSWSQQAFVREKATLDDLRRAVAALAARSGKRILVLVSDGLELHPGQILSQTFGPSSISQWDYSVTNDLSSVIAEANSAGVTVHAIDAKGLTSDSDAAESGPSPFGSFFVSQTLKEPLAEVSRQTGGTLLTNRNTFQAAFDRIYRDASSYYSIGVTLSNLDTRAKDHKVDVATTRPGVEVRTRPPYTPKTAGAATHDRMEMALLNPAARGDFPVAVAIGPPKKGGGLGHRLAPYEVRVPMSALSFRDEGGKKTATFEIALAAVRDNGERSGFRPDRKTVSIPDAEWEKAKGDAFRYTGEMKTGTGNFRFVATVRDVATDAVGLGTASVHID